MLSDKQVCKFKSSLLREEFNNERFIRDDHGTWLYYLDDRVPTR